MIVLPGLKLFQSTRSARSATYLGMKTTSYQRIEAGTRKGDIELWDALEDLFKVPQRQLRATEKEPDGNPAK